MKKFPELLANRTTGILFYAAALIGLSCTVIGIQFLVYALVSTAAIYFIYPLVAPLISSSLPPTISLFAAFGASILLAVLIAIGKTAVSRRK